MTIALALLVVIAHTMSFLVAWRIGLLTGLTRFQAIVAGYAIALIAPSLITLWLLMAPIGFDRAVVIASAVIIGPAIFVLVSGRIPRPYPRRRVTRSTMYAALPPAIVIATVIGLTLIAALSKPVEEIDGLLYHGPAAANFIQHGSLFGWDAPAPYVFYPALLPLQGAGVVEIIGSVDLLDAVQVPYLLLLGAVVWVWAGRGRPTALAGMLAAAVICTPAVYANARALYVDVGYAAVLLTGLWLLWLWLGSARRTHLVAGCLLLGGAASIKPAGLTVCAAAAAAVVVFSLWRHRRHGIADVAVIIAGFAAGAVPFYLRNLIEFRNPVYPVSADIAGIHMEGLIDLDAFQSSPPPEPLTGMPGLVALMRNLTVGATRFYEPIFYDARVGAFGPVVLLLAVALLAAIAFVVGRRLWRDRSYLIAVGLPLAAAVVIALLQPQPWYPRYVIATFALVVICIGVTLETSRLPARPAIAASLCGLLIIGGLVWMTERRLFQNLWALNAIAEVSPAYNHGVSGTTQAYQDSYSWVRGAACGTKVVVAAGTFQSGLLNSYGLGLWGDRLCNDVTLVRDRRGAGDQGLEGDRRGLVRALREADFAVVFEQDRALVEQAARRNGLVATVVSDTIDYYGADQVVYSLRPSPRGR